MAWALFPGNPNHLLPLAGSAVKKHTETHKRTRLGLAAPRSSSTPPPVFDGPAAWTQPSVKSDKVCVFIQTLLLIMEWCMTATFRASPSFRFFQCSADSLPEWLNNIYTLFTFSARPIQLNSPATCNDCYGSEVSPPTEMLNSGGSKLFGEEFTRGWGLVLRVTKNLQTAKRTACQSSLPTVPRGFSSAATPSSIKKAKSRKKASKKNFRAILDLLAGGAGTEASYINTHSQTPPGWRIIRTPPCHLPLNITAKKHRYLQRGHQPVEMNMQGAFVCSFMTLSFICRKKCLRSFLCA